MSPSKHTHTYIYNIIKIIKTFEVKNYIIIISSILKNESATELSILICLC